MVSLTKNEYDVLRVGISWIVGFLPLFTWAILAHLGRKPSWNPPTWSQSVGLALIASPFVTMGIGFALTVNRLFTFTVLQPAPRSAIWRAVYHDALYDFAIPLVGLLLLTNAIPFFASRRAPRMGVGTMLRRHGLAPRQSFGRDATDGLALFAFIAVAYVGAYVLSKTVFAQLGANGDESHYWQNITVLLIVLRSGMAGLTEEFLFRGLLLSALRRRLPFLAAALIQGLAFALVHTGYGTWLHVAGPLAFGLGMAWVASVLGVTVTAMLHAQVNIVFFALDVAGYVPGTWWLIGVLVVANIAAAFFTRFEAIRLLWRSLMSPFRLGAKSGISR